MSKALVIKGASFLANRVEQIDISDPIPCTGITLSQSALVFSQIGETATLTATLTPADTTDTLTWVSSNEDVATISNGVVTCTGIGTAIITAMCGVQSATCDVGLTSVTIILGADYVREENVRLGGSVNISQGKTYCSVATMEYASLFYSNVNTLNGYKAFYSIERDNCFCIPIPKGATNFNAVSSNNNLYIMSCAFDTNEQASARPNTSASWSSKAVAVRNGTGSISLSLVEYPDANGFALSIQNNTSPSATDLTATVTVTFT